ncbi:beta-glucosidase [Opitutaceae bacterium EW11]|nr:beta-glucosidase [Opitutaceae bacterium EW11]
MPSHSFPKDFVWGLAAAAPQIEGAAFDDGKGPSTWDTFSRQPGKVLHGDTLDVACDHYHRFDEDFALMARLGVRHYRLSLAWPRLCPHGDRRLNQPGIDFYHRLFDSMERHGITPWVTLYHWDLPQALEDQGGWRSRGVIDAFAFYADTAVRAFRDRVTNWITLNEISCFTRMAYGTGRKAPGLRESEAVVNQTYHHALVCHGHGVRAVREHGAKMARVGLTDNPTIPIPITSSPGDVAAAENAFVDDNIRVLDPLHHGRYRPRYREIAGDASARAGEGDFALISLPTDYLGLNLYSGYFVRAGSEGPYERLPFSPSYPKSDSPWHFLVPQVLDWGPRLAARVYGVEDIFLTEHGVGFDDDAPNQRGEVIDLHRREFLRSHLQELHRGIADGVPVRGCFIWSYIDNFEWQDGYQRRFGIVHNDFKTQVRTPKLSAQWFAQLIAQNALP